MDLKELIEIDRVYKELRENYSLLARLALALTTLDEASIVLGLTSEDINDLRKTVNEQLGDFHG